LPQKAGNNHSLRESARTIAARHLIKACHYHSKNSYICRPFFKEYAAEYTKRSVILAQYGMR
jgi:hypothetical protein